MKKCVLGGVKRVQEDMMRSDIRGLIEEVL